MLPVQIFFIIGGFFLSILGLYMIIKDIPQMLKTGIVNLGPFGGQYPIFKRDNPKEYKIWLVFKIVLYISLLTLGVLLMIFPFII